MAEFHIKGHITREGPTRYVAVAVVVPAGREGRYADLVEEPAETHVGAIEKLRAIAVSLGEQIRQRGDEVLAVHLIES